jgi:hypothetical protein
LDVARYRDLCEVDSYLASLIVRTSQIELMTLESLRRWAADLSDGENVHV